MVTVEKWVKCPYANKTHEVSDKGRIRNLRNQHVLSPGYNNYGYLHEREQIDAEWHAEGVDYYAEEVLSKDYPTSGQVKTLIKIIKNAKEQQ